MKILILAYDYPPYNSVGGLRPKSWERDFNNNGAYPIVVTRDWNAKFGDERDYFEASDLKEVEIKVTDNHTVIKTPYSPALSISLLKKYGPGKFKLLRKSLTFLFEILQFFIPVGSKKNLYRGAKEYLKHNKVDAILATGEPFVLFYHAYWLSKKFDIPYVLDYRDPWSQNATRSSLIMKRFYARLEKKVTRNANGITTVSDEFRETISNGFDLKNIEIFPNGFNAQAFEGQSSINQSREELVITIGGSTYQWHPIGIFIRGLIKVCLERNDVDVKFNIFGANELMRSSVEDALLKDALPSNLKISVEKRIPNSELVTNLLRSNVLLLFNDYDIIGTKIFDYIGAQRKILLCFEKDVESLKLKDKFFHYGGNELISKQVDLIKKTNSGIALKDQKHLVLILNDLFDEFRQNKYIKCETINPQNYSRQYSNMKMVDYLKRISR